ncbi:MAG: Hint domain-containing protein [Pseudomonadota bacterium]
MADFNYVDGAIYQSSGGGFVTNISAGTITDVDNDDQFEIGDSSGTLIYNGTVEIAGITMAVFQDNTLTFIHVFNPGPAAVLNYPGTYPFSSNSPGTVFPFCFAAGSLIATPEGETKVEALKIGDLVRTADGRTVSVLWVGWQSLHRWRHGAHMQPVRIKAGALGGGLPHSDLTVTADHGMVVDRFLINAAALVNGDTIDFVPMAELGNSFTVYHIETENHDVILANGAPSETFIDAAFRSHFDNHQEYLDLYGAERIIPENPMPRIATARLVPEAIKARLSADGTSATQRAAASDAA